MKINQTNNSSSTSSAETKSAATPSQKLLIGLIVFSTILLSAVIFLAYQNYQLRHRMPPLPTFDDVEELPRSSTNPTLTTENWKTYTDKDGLYSLRYPPHWQVEQRIKDWGKFQGTPYTFLYQRKVEFAPGISIFTFPSTSPAELLGKSLEYDGVTITSITLGGKPATFVDGIPGALLQKYYFVNREDQTIVIFTDTDSREMENVANQILSTFTFLDQEADGTFCGGIANISCPEGYTCKLDGKYPDAGGTCVKDS